MRHLTPDPRSDRMDPPEYAALRAHFHIRQAAIGQAWYRAIVASAAIVLFSATMCDSLTELVGQIIEVLLAEPFAREPARAIGSALPTVLGSHPIVLGTTLETLAGELVAGLPAHQVAALQPRLAVLLSELSVGFLVQAQGTCTDHPPERQPPLVDHRYRLEAAVHQRTERSTAAKPIRVFLADDHPLIRSGIGQALADTLDMDLVGEAASGDVVRQGCRAVVPDVVLLDLHMPGPSPFALIPALRADCPTLQVAILSAFDDARSIRGALAAGVTGYILKDEDTTTIVRAIRTIAHGTAWFSRSVTMQLAQWAGAATPAPPHSALTPRDIHLLRWLVAGKSNREMAMLLGVGEKAVEKAMRGLFTKLDVTTRVMAAVRAVRDGLLEDNTQDR